MAITISFNIDGRDETLSLRPYDEAWHREYDRIEALDDIEERAVRFRLLEAIEQKVADYYINEMNYGFRMHLKKLSERGIRFTRVENAAPMKARWTRLFASGLTAEDKKRVFYGQYRWHAFSYELIGCLSGDAARRAFDECEKSGACLFFQHEGCGYAVGNARLLKASDLDYENTPNTSDAYLFDPGGAWTYVRTHEAYCGPYFVKKT